MAVKNRWPGSGVWLLDCSYRSSRSERQVCDVLPPLEDRAPGPAIDPNLPAGLLQSGRTARHRFSCLASTKRLCVTSHSRPQPVVEAVRRSPRRCPVSRCSRHSSTAVQWCPFTKVVAQGRPNCSRGTFGRSGSRDRRHRERCRQGSRGSTRDRHSGMNSSRLAGYKLGNVVKR